MSSIDKFYVSDIDKTLTKFNADHKPSAAQQAEIDKYQAIYQKRDHLQPATDANKSDLWEDF